MAISSHIPASIFQGVQGLPCTERERVRRLEWDFQTGSHCWNLGWILHQLFTLSSVALCMNFGASISGVSMAGVQHYPTLLHKEAGSM